MSAVLDGRRLALSALDEREAVIDGALRTFVDVGRALADIRDQQLYKERGFKSFEIYCRERWSWSRNMADRTIAASRVSSLIDDNCHQIAPPANEAQARPLLQLAEDQQPAVWAEVVATAPSGKVTAKHVESVVRAHLPTVKPPVPEPFHLLIEIGELRAKVSEWVADWPGEARAKALPTILRDFADEYEARK